MRNGKSPECDVRRTHQRDLRAARKTQVNFPTCRDSYQTIQRVNATSLPIHQGSKEASRTSSGSTENDFLHGKAASGAHRDCPEAGTNNHAVDKPHRVASPRGLSEHGEGGWPKGRSKGTSKARIALTDWPPKESASCTAFWSLPIAGRASPSSRTAKHWQGE